MLAHGCAPELEEPLPPQQAERVYDELYPYYVELCAVSQIHPKFASHGNFTKVEPNLRYFQAKYEAILASRSPDTSGPHADSAKDRARTKYYEYIAAQLRDVKGKLARLRMNR